jgi:hypothetical protein
LAKLNKTGSPLQSEAFDEPQLCVVERAQDALTLQLIFNFHEGGPRFRISEDGSFATLDAAGFAISNLAFEVESPGTFKLGFDRFRPQIYSFAGQASLYSAQYALVGKYTDASGRKYLFRSDGHAVFPDRSFDYELGLDHVENHYDFFRDKSGKKNYAFKRGIDRLEIFGTTGENEQFVEKSPLLTLRRPRPCTEIEAQQADQAIDHLPSWDDLYGFYKQFAQCDDGSIAEGVSDAVARLLAERWDTFPHFVSLISSDSIFKEFVVDHVDETAPVDALHKISDNANRRCPHGQTHLCKEIARVATSLH